MALVRYATNPVLSAKDVPYDASLIFNAGVCKYQGKYVMIFRNDAGFSPDGNWGKVWTNLGIAYSSDGVKWDVNPEPWKAAADFVASDPEILRIYDPRLTVIDGRCYLCFAVDTRHGVRGGIAVTEDFESLEVLSMSAPDNRNMVLFPEKIGGKFVRLERPFPEYSRGYKEKFDIWSSFSPDCRYWGDTRLVLGMEDVPYANAKIGPAAPPIRTRAGWLVTFHATIKNPDRRLNGWETKGWFKEYVAGLMLLDGENPQKVIGLAPEPLLRSVEKYELEGFRGSVIFPGGMILEESGEVKIYYGGADTVECLASAPVEELLGMIRPLPLAH